METEIRVLLADDHPMVREGLKASLDGESGIHIIASVDNGEDAIQAAKALSPDVILMDISMPVMGGIEAISVLSKEMPDIKLLPLTMHEEREYIHKLVQLGACGYVLKNVDAEEIILAIQTVHRGGTFFSSGTTKYLVGVNNDASENNRTTLTQREESVLALVAEGLCNKEIAGQLSISVRTAEVHRQNIRKKLNIKTAAGLVRYALEKAKGIL
ncbi:response regulator transcription factor [Endozoicomonas sp. SESOKO1]|uniref:response regulator n=1 Tax=Endozoicomonas sp. SESOKO1 TaxID=2828742 RepID=UPI002147B693|nr:response regulator transcription factor [Endozoicomonas sp. SESOKO1]